MRNCILLFFFFPFAAFAQKKDTVLKYLNANLQPTTKKNAVYAGVAIKQQGSWFLYGLYPDTTPVVKAWYKDKQLTIKNGPYAVFYPRNIPAQIGHYSDNKMNGVWQSWYPNGQKKDSGLVVNDQLVGGWKEWHPNGILMYACTYGERPANLLTEFLTLYPGLKTGVFTSWYDNGNMESSGFYKDDVMEGEWKWFHNNGRPSTVETYKEGKVISLKCFDTTGKETGEFCSLSKPAVLKGFGDYKEFIFQNLTWPEEAVKKKMEGSVKVSFKINKNGTLEDLMVEGDHEVFKKAVIELFGYMKEWYPAVSHNRVVDWEDKIEIPFYRNN